MNKNGYRVSLLVVRVGCAWFRFVFDEYCYEFTLRVGQRILGFEEDRLVN